MRQSQSTADTVAMAEGSWSKVGSPAAPQMDVNSVGTAQHGGRTVVKQKRVAAIVKAPSKPVEQRAPKTAQPKSLAYERSGWARWMGKSWKGHITATGEVFDAERLTAAHATLPVPSFLYVTNRANGRTLLVRVNDRVPAAKDRVVVVSQLAADLLGFRAVGRTQVDLQFAGPAAKTPNGRHEEAFLKSQTWFHAGLLHERKRKIEVTSVTAAALAPARGNAPR